MTETENFLSVAERLARDAGDLCLKLQGNLGDVKYKSAKDVVKEAAGKVAQAAGAAKEKVMEAVKAVKPADDAEIEEEFDDAFFEDDEEEAPAEEAPAEEAAEEEAPAEEAKEE